MANLMSREQGEPDDLRVNVLERLSRIEVQLAGVTATVQTLHQQIRETQTYIEETTEATAEQLDRLEASVSGSVRILARLCLVERSLTATSPLRSWEPRPASA